MLDAEITKARELIGQARDRGVPELYWFAADYLLTVKTAERDWILNLTHRMERRELEWPSDSK